MHGSEPDDEDDERSTLDDTISRERFIRLGALLGVGVAGSSALAACGGGSGSGGSGGGSGSGGSGGGAIARASEVSPGSAVEFQDGGQPAVLVGLEGGELAAYSAVCTHAGCTVAYRGGQLACPCHGSAFDPANGEVVAAPAERPLTEIPVEVRNGEVFRA